MLEFLYGIICAAVISGTYLWSFLRKNNQLKISLAITEQECESLKQKQSYLTQLENDKLQITKEYAALQATLHNLEHQQQIHSNELQESKVQINNQAANIMNLQQEKLELAKKCVALQTELKNIHEQYQLRLNDLKDVKTEINQHKDNLANIEQEKFELGKKYASLQTELKSIQEQHQLRLDDLKEAKDQLRSQFAELAGKIFAEREQHANQNFKQILEPLKEKIIAFEKRVESSYTNEARERFALGKELHNLQQLNQKLSDEAHALSQALRGQKTQGTWGEMVLERILEFAGLTKGREYHTQVNLKDASGAKLIPDVLIELPDNRQIIIDSKVSLNAYRDLQITTNKERITQLTKQHVLSIKNHIKNLTSKQYHNLEELHSLDLILLFVPIDAALNLALEHEPNLFQEAYAQHIVLISPTTMLATLKVINSLWQQEKQTKNAREIAENAGKLYDKLVDFVQDLTDVGTRLKQMEKSYNAAFNKLSDGRGNLIKRAQELHNLGARANKNLPPKLLEN